MSIKYLIKSQIIPATLSILTFLGLIWVLLREVYFLNNWIGTKPISLVLKPQDIAVGLFIYFKTSVDFIIYIGRYIEHYSGWKNRVAMEAGTAIGNAFGTMIILSIWVFFHGTEWILVIMIFVASLILLRLAQEGLVYVFESSFKRVFNLVIDFLLKPFGFIVNSFIPKRKDEPHIHLSFFSLLKSSIKVPFVLGLDDFAGYIPVFTVVNVVGFAVGVFAGHMILNLSLFLSPRHTIAVIKNQIVEILGSLFFVALSFYGFFEVARILLKIIQELLK